MENHFQLSDHEFVHAFKTQTLNPKLFTHEAHIRLAWIYLNTYTIEQAIEQFSNQLFELVTLHKATDKFNKTLTVAAFYIIHHFKINSNAKDFKAFINTYPELVLDFKSLVKKHYKRDVFNCPKAKKSFVEPDLILFNQIELKTFV